MDPDDNDFVSYLLIILSIITILGTFIILLFIVHAPLRFSNIFGVNNAPRLKWR